MKKTRFVVVGLAALLLTASTVCAQQQAEVKEPTGKRGEKIFQELNLTKEQQDKMTANRKAQRQEMMKLREQIRQKQEQLQESLGSASVTPASVGPLVNDIKSLQSQLIDLRINGIFAVKAIMTPEQFAKFQQLTQERQKERKGRSAAMHEKGLEAPPSKE